MSLTEKKGAATSDLEKEAVMAGPRRDSLLEKIDRRLSVTSGGDVSAREGQMFSMTDIDPALDAKMHIVNNVGRQSCH